MDIDDKKPDESPWQKLSWIDARHSGLLWFINATLQNVGLSIFLEGDVQDEEFTSEPTARLGHNPCRGFEEDEQSRQAFSRWLADNAQRMHRQAFPPADEDVVD